MRSFKILIILLFIGVCNGFSQTPGNTSSGLLHWFKADAADMTTSGGAGTEITQWDDQSGNGLDAVRGAAAVAGDEPILVTDYHNHNSSVLFSDGTNGHFDFDLRGISSSDYTIIAVMERNLGGTHNYFIGSLAIPDGMGGETGDTGLTFGYRAGSVDGYYVAQPGSTQKASFPNYDADTEEVTLVRTTLEQAATDPRLVSVLSNGQETVGSTGSDGDGLLVTLATDGKIGRGSDVAQGFHGYVSEIIVYNNAIDAISLKRVESYLAVKYGMTLDGNYVNSTDGVIWDATTNATYHNDVIAIGVDNDSALSQLMSTEQTEDTNLTIAEETTLVTGDYLFVGNDDGNTTLTATLASTADATYERRFERTWMADITGVAGRTVSVSITIPGTNIGDVSDYALLMDTDTDFSDGVAHTTGASLIGNVITFTNVDFNTNNIFTLGAKLISAPGGLNGSSLTHWFKAGEGISLVGGTGVRVSQWDDQSGNGSDAVLTSGVSNNYPRDVEVLHNYNPSVRFINGDIAYFEVDLSTLEASDYNIIAVTNRTSTNNQTYFLGTQDVGGATGDGISLGYRRNSSRYNLSHSSDTSYGPTFPVFVDADTEVPALLNASLEVGTLSTFHVLVDGVEETTSATNADLTSALLEPAVGTLGTGSNVSHGYYGNVSELIIYNRRIDDTTEISKIESYLAIKYGLSLVENYLDSEQNILWNVVDNATYNNDVAGIGRDDASLLNQKQSKSSSLDDILTISINGTVAASNALNGGSFDDNLDFLIWGNDGTTSTISLVDLVGSSRPCVKQLDRNWKISNIGSVGGVTLQFDITDFTPLTYDLIIDNDGDGNYTTGSPVRIATGTLDGTGDLLTFTNVTLPHGAVFTLGESDAIENDIVYDGTDWLLNGVVDTEFDATDGDKAVVIQSSVQLSAGDHNCRCLVIENGANVTVTTGNVLTIEGGGLELQGNLYLEGTSELAQTGTYNRNVEGTGQVHKILNEANSSAFKYNYFASPVHDAAGEFSIGADLKIDDELLTLGDGNITPGFISNDLEGFGTTFSTRWFHTLIDGGAFTEIDQNQKMTPGVGFTMKGTSTANAYNVIGFPNNGVIEINVSAGNSFLTGNPYSSSISTESFFAQDDNLATTDDTIYLWDSGTAVQTDHSPGLVDDIGGYATITSGVTVSKAILLDLVTEVTGAVTPTGFIKPGQGFIFFSTDGGTVTFDNSMRMGVANNTAAHFFKAQEVQTVGSSKGIVRLGFEYQTENNQTFHRQLATVLNEGNTGEDKNTYMFDYYNDDAYWVANEESSRFIIRNISNADANLELPIGVVLASEKEVSFKIDDVEDFTNDIYLLDKQEDTVTKISTTETYTTVVEGGDNQERFSLIFAEDVFLDTEIIDNATKTVLYVQDQSLHAVLETGTIKEVEVYNLRGQLIVSKNNEIATGNITVDLSNSLGQLLVVKIITSNGTLTKKFILD